MEHLRTRQYFLKLQPQQASRFPNQSCHLLVPSVIRHLRLCLSLRIDSYTKGASWAGFSIFPTTHLSRVFSLFFIEVYFIYNVVLVSGVQQSDSVIYMC